MHENRPTSQRGMTLLEILFATMILSVGLLSIMSIFPLGVESHSLSVQEEKSAMIVDSIKDAINIGAKSPYKEDDSDDTPVKIVVVHDGTGAIVNGLPEGREILTLPLTAQALNRQDDTGSEEGFDIKYESNDVVRYPDQEEERVYPLGQVLLQDNLENRYFNDKDDLSGYSFDIEIREAVTVRRPRTDHENPKTEITDSKLRVYELASNDHSIYEFTIRIYRNWKKRSSAQVDNKRENSKLVHVYSFVVNVPKVKR